MTGAQLKAWRSARHITQDALAQRTGVSVRSIRNYEAGTTTPPRWLPVALAAYDQGIRA